MLLPGGTTDLGEGELHAPHLTLVAQAIFADGLQLGVAVAEVRMGTTDMSGASSRSVAFASWYVQTGSLEWAPGNLVGLAGAASMMESVLILCKKRG